MGSNRKGKGASVRMRAGYDYLSGILDVRCEALDCNILGFGECRGLRDSLV